MSNHTETFITNNDIVCIEPIGYESTLGWGNHFGKNWFHSIGNNFGHNSVINIAEADRPKFSDLSRLINYGN